MSGREATWSPEARARQSALASESLRGHPVSAETREKIAAAQRGERAYQWAGDNVGYSGIHKRACLALPRLCARADETCRGRLEVALRADAIGPFGEDRRGVFSRRVEDYWRLCRSHHNRQDGKAPPPETRLNRRRKD